MYEKTRAEGFGPEVQRRVMIGTYVLSAGFYDAYYNRARKVRTLIKRDFEQVFDAGIDAILTPATPSAAFGLGEMADADPVQMYLQDIYTIAVNLAGLPGLIRGLRLASQAGDINGDGVDDFAVSAPYHMPDPNTGISEGKVYLWMSGE